VTFCALKYFRNTASGTGYRNMTRLVASQWAMWRDIRATNSPPVAEALGVVIERLKGLREELEGNGGELAAARSLFEQAHQFTRREERGGNDSDS